MSNHAAPRRSLPRWLAWFTLTVSAAWLILTGSLWLATGKSLPVINVRWASSVTAELRVQTEHELSLILKEPKAEQRTGVYYVTEPDAQALKRIVTHPLVEDTAHISRSTFVLEGAPYEHWWIGDRWTVLKQPVLFFAAVFGGLAAAAVLLLPGRRQ